MIETDEHRTSSDITDNQSSFEVFLSVPDSSITDEFDLSNITSTEEVLPASPPNRHGISATVHNM